MKYAVAAETEKQQLLEPGATKYSLAQHVRNLWKPLLPLLHCLLTYMAFIKRIKRSLSSGFYLHGGSWATSWNMLTRGQCRLILLILHGRQPNWLLFLALTTRRADLYSDKIHTGIAFSALAYELSLHLLLASHSQKMMDCRSLSFHTSLLPMPTSLLRWKPVSHAPAFQNTMT